MGLWALWADREQRGPLTKPPQLAQLSSSGRSASAEQWPQGGPLSVPLQGPLWPPQDTPGPRDRMSWVCSQACL